MLPVSVAQIAEVTGGRLHSEDPALLVTGSAVIDSRQAGLGDLFAAFAGDHVDGHDFAAQAVSAGAVAVLASRPVPVPSIVVPDVQTGLGTLAAWSARQMQTVTRIGVTGSSGKTTTKDLLEHVLCRLGKTVATVGSRNNEIGVPLTALSVSPGTRYLVLEMGARGIGHLSYLTGIVPLDVAVVLNVGAAHAGEFGSLEVTAEAKGELVEALPVDGVAVLNADDRRVAAMAPRSKAPVTWFGLGPAAQVRAEGISVDDLSRARFTLITPGGRAAVSLRILGEHQVANALAAAAVAHALGMPARDIAAVLSDTAVVTRSRMQMHERPDGVRIIDDAYNANPDSLRASLRALAAMAAAGRRVAVVGEMRELGDRSPDEHRAVGKFAASLGIDVVVGVGGADAAQVAEGVAQGGAAARLVPDRAAAAELLDRMLVPGDLVLVKASRDAGLRALVSDLVPH